MKSAFKKIGVLIGCRGVVFAKMTSDDESGTVYAEEIKSAPGVVELALTAQTTNESLGADDISLYEILTSLDGFDVNLTMASLSAEAQAYLLGSTLDSNGVLVEKASDTPPYVAMGFITARSDGSDDYYWLYKGRFAQSDATFRTKEQGAVNWQTPVLTGSFAPRASDGNLRASVNTKETTASAVISTFFDKVYEGTDAAAE